MLTLDICHWSNTSSCSAQANVPIQKDKREDMHFEEIMVTDGKDGARSTNSVLDMAKGTSINSTKISYRGRGSNWQPIPIRESQAVMDKQHYAAQPVVRLGHNQLTAIQEPKNLGNGHLSSHSSNNRTRSYPRVTYITAVAQCIRYK
jgi:hypothetical protein